MRSIEHLRSSMKTISYNDLPEDVQKTVAALPNFTHRVRSLRGGGIQLRPSATTGNVRGWKTVVDIPPGQEKKTAKIIPLRQNI